MQLLAAEARELRNTPPVNIEQSSAALHAASERLGDEGAAVAAGRARGAHAERRRHRRVAQLARRGALGRPRAAGRSQPHARCGGYSGSIVVALGGARLKTAGGRPARCWARWRRWWPGRRPPGWPAPWPAATGQRLQLADARGSVWSGSAVPVLTGGAGSRDASALPGRLQWSLGLDGAALALRAAPGLLHQRRTAAAPAARRRPPAVQRCRPPAAPSAQWPASWLVGLGTPFNTLAARRRRWRSAAAAWWPPPVQGRWQLDGGAALVIEGLSSRSRRSTRWAATSSRWWAVTTSNLLLLSTLQGPLRSAATASGRRASCASAATPGPTRAPKPR